MKAERIRSLAGLARSRLSIAALKRAALVVGGVAGALAAVVGAVVSFRVALRCVRMALDSGRVAFAVLTLQLYRRCPDCRRWIRGDSRVCWRCGWRRPGRRWPRPSGRF
jgi:hypothetical protein